MWPMCLLGDFTESHLLVPHWQCFIGGGTACGQGTVLSLWVRECQVRVLLCEICAVGRAQSFCHSGTCDYFSKAQMSTMVWIQLHHHLSFLLACLCLCPPCAPSLGHIPCGAPFSLLLSHLCSSKKLNLHLKPPL